MTLSATPSANPKRGRGMNAVFTILVLMLAFLTASFLADNSDLWFHLATGRLLAHGEFPFGADPFAYTTSHVYWACHSWLFDWMLYGLRGSIGDPSLVVIKSLMVAALAGLLMRIRRPDDAMWLSVVCTTLAILALGPHLLLQPACLSYFLLGLTFWLLWRLHSQKKRSRLSLFLLPLVFTLWVNVDEWFLLGPLLVALFWLGERLGGQRRTPGWLVPVGLAVCLLNPYTYHALTLPAALSTVPWTSGLWQDARFRLEFASPWQTEYRHAAAHLDAAILAYYALTVLGLVSFLLNRSALRDWRLLVWLPFALLAAWQARLIPIFAVVAAPIAALNLSPKYAVSRTKRRLVRGISYLGLILGLLALILLAWMGWLAGYDREERHVAWGIQEDPSLREAAETLALWHNQGLLHSDERIFALTPEVAHYGVFFCPGEKHFFDHRYPLFSQAVGDYETVSSALLRSPGDEARSTKDAEKHQPADWQKVLRDRKVGIVVYYDRDWHRLFPILNRLSSDRDNWTLLHVAGQVLIAGWNAARPAKGFAALAFDPDRLAFGPRTGNPLHRVPRAPERGPAQLPARRDWRDRLAHPAAAPSWESSAATAYLSYFEHSTGAQQERSPALLLLTIRAARRAVAADPRDANAWLRLGQAYLLLRDLICERSAQGLLPPLAQLRQVQIATALEQAVRLDPNLKAAHHELAILYEASNVLDRALQHRREELRLHLDLPDKDTAKLVTLVEDNRRKFAARTRSFQGDRVAQARQLLKLGLARQAVDEILMSTPPDALGAAGIRLEMELLLSLGRAQEVRGILSKREVLESKHRLGFSDIHSPLDRAKARPYSQWPAFEWLRIQAAAASGDYGVCRNDLRMIRAMQQIPITQLRKQAREIQEGVWKLLAGALSGPQPFVPEFFTVPLSITIEQKSGIEAALHALQGQQADENVLEGMLALEQGDVDAARAAFAEAMKLGMDLPFAGRPLSATYLGKLKK